MHSARLVLTLVGLVVLAPAPSHGFRFRRPAAQTQTQVRPHSLRLRALGQGLLQRCRGACDAARRLQINTGKKLHHFSQGIQHTRDRVVHSKVVQGTVAAAKQAGRWAKKHPAKAVGLGLGAVAMFGTVFYVAPALSAGISGCLTPVIGETAAGVVGTASGGALACGSRSLLVHTTPMVAGVDPFNAKQLATDVGMSSTFGFFGFAQAATLRTITGSLGASGLGLFAANYVGLVGYELLKDYLQNRIRNRVANDPKSFREIWKSSLLMESASNIHRCIPGLHLETNFGAKIIGDLGGTIWWDRIVNKRNAPKKQQPSAPNDTYIRDALTE
jgi:ElaB/YqjD/DUF883 family membrane-anchored ribosome-binding protein